jgi:IrrE N-terminal-like domain
MKLVRDQTGRFAKRPHYLPTELDEECERLIAGFLTQRYGQVAYPINTDDLTVLLESLVESLDLYADLSAEEGEVEGVTDFVPGGRPRVRVSKRLTDDPRMANRLRTTLTHELGHVRFHAFLFDVEQTGNLFGVNTSAISNKCNRATMLQAAQTDWIEWQAGYCCGALLMPSSALRVTIRDFMTEQNVAVAKFALHSTEGQALLDAVARSYQVSRDAARVRLLQRGTLAEAAMGAGLL